MSWHAVPHHRVEDDFDNTTTGWKNKTSTSQRLLDCCTVQQVTYADVHFGGSKTSAENLSLDYVWIDMLT